MRSRQSCKPHAVRHDFRNTIGPRWPVSRRRGTFSAAGSGAGATGFDSTNTRKTRTKGKAKKSTDAQMIAPGIPVATAISPYDKSADVTGSVPAGTPGTPPVELGPIRTAPKKRKAHTEPEDPYAPLGIRAGAFDLFAEVTADTRVHDLNSGFQRNSKGVTGKIGAKFERAPADRRSRARLHPARLRGPAIRGHKRPYRRRIADLDREYADNSQTDGPINDRGINDPRRIRRALPRCRIAG